MAKLAAQFFTETNNFHVPGTSTKGQLITKCLFGVFNSNERKQFELRYHSSKVEFFRSFFGRIEDTKKTF